MSSMRAQLVWSIVAAAILAGAVGYVVGTSDNRPPSEIDVGFVQDMIRHHEQAVQLALIAFHRSEDPTVRAFAQEVILFQQREIGIMDTMLSNWGLSRDSGEEVMEWMGMPMPLAEMPGYADAVEVEALREAEGSELDMLFLTLLATHHVGGIQMAAFAAENARDDDVRRLAEIITRNQATEIPEYADTADRLDLPALAGSPTLEELAELAVVAQR